jgi:YVTN family beta-propeller protein
VPASAAGGYAVTATISAGTYPFGVAADPVTHTVYVSNGDGTVSVIDAATNTVTGTIALRTDPAEMVADPAAGTVYVGGNGTMSVIDAATNTVTDTITGIDPWAIAVDPAARTVFAGSNGGDTVWVIDTATNTVTDTITVGVVPRGVAVDPISHTVYVANFYDDTLSVISHGQASAITSAPAYTATIGKPMHLVITATGYPAPTVTESGALPCGLHFISTRNGRAAITGTPGKGMAGRYPITITAANQFGSASQTFVLTVRRPHGRRGHSA